MENTKETKKVSLQLVGLDENAFSLMGAFQKQARREGWTKKRLTRYLQNVNLGITHIY